jgi:hypothetical protein
MPRQGFEGLTRQRGKPEFLGPPRPEPPGVAFPVRFQHGTLELKLVLNQRDQIAGFRFTPPQSPDSDLLFFSALDSICLTPPAKLSG